MLLGAGTFLATRLAGAAPSSGSSLELTPASRIALGGMWLMTLLGLSTGVAGALLENVLGPSAVVLLLHGESVALRPGQRGAIQAAHQAPSQLRHVDAGHGLQLLRGRDAQPGHVGSRRLGGGQHGHARHLERTL